MKWLLNKRTGMMLFCSLILIAIAMLANIVGISVAGDIQEWTIWLKAHAPIFLIWRICLYTAVSYGWYWMRCRVIERESEKDNQQHVKKRFFRIEVSAICIFIIMEISNWLA